MNFASKYQIQCLGGFFFDVKCCCDATDRGKSWPGSFARFKIAYGAHAYAAIPRQFLLRHTNDITRILQVCGDVEGRPAAICDHVKVPSGRARRYWRWTCRGQPWTVSEGTLHIEFITHLA
jgi:hypothetical protein